MRYESPFIHEVVDNFLPENLYTSLHYKASMFPLKKSVAKDHRCNLGTKRSFLHPEIEMFEKLLLDTVEALFGEAFRILNTTVFSYSKGDFYGIHTDKEVEGRKVSFILYLSVLGMNDGGSLRFYKDKLFDKEILPRENRLVVFPVTDKTFHEVARVNTDVRRLSISGWLC